MAVTELSTDNAGPVAFVLKGYPRLSETFIAQEIEGLERAGLDIRIYSLRRPTDRARHPIHDHIRAPVAYLPEYLHAEPRRVWRAWRRARRLEGYRAARRAWLRDLRRDATRNRIRRFGQALVLATELAPEVTRLHAHFLHTPASVARYAAILAGLPWSCSAHAKDIWTIPEWEKREKLASADWLVTCTRFGARHLAALAPAPDRVELVYHGLDLARFPPRPRRDTTAGGNGETVILSVGRAVAKKGFRRLLQALAGLPTDLAWRLVHVGGGPLLSDLRALAADLGLSERVDWRGPQPQEAVLRAYREADLFVLASRIAADGDRDGLPNVLLEAQSQALACVSTDVAGIPELIEHGRNGLLVPPDDVPALTAALGELIRRPDVRDRLGKAGERLARTRFRHEIGLRRLAEKFGAGPPAAHRAAAAE